MGMRRPCDRLFPRRRNAHLDGLLGSFNPRIERLEERTLLANGVATPVADIVVGRTQSVVDSSQTPAVSKPAYFVADVQGLASTSQFTLTLTVYNEQASAETGVLLTDTLAPGVSLVSADVPPDQQGQKLAFSLGTIAGFGRESVTLTLHLPGAIPGQIDTGASVYATLNAGSVSNSTPAAALRAGSLSDPSLLGSTPDANTTDPFIQEEAAKLGYDPQTIFDFLHNQIGYNSYTGSVRGARGTLWSLAGNALDVSSLGVALMRASGIPAQYAQGTLSQAQAQTLIVSMFPASYQTVGYVPAGTQTGDPANDPQLLAETESHDWFQLDTGTGMRDADPLIAGATIGQSFTVPTGTFAVVPDASRAKTEIKLNAEFYSLAAALFGLGGLSTTTVLDQTFNDVDLVGRPITVGNFVTTNSAGALFFTATTHTFSPHLILGDDAYPDESHDEVLHGQDYQEVLTNFPFGTQILTGLFLDVTLSGPQGAPQTYEKTLADRIGYDLRQNGGSPNLSITPASPTLVSPFDVWSVSVLPGVQDPATAVTTSAALPALYADLGNKIAANNVTAVDALTRVLTGQARSYLDAYLSVSGYDTQQLSAAALVTAYLDRPRITVISAAVSAQGTQKNILKFESDLMSDPVRALAGPGQATSALSPFQTARGILENVLESQVFPTPAPGTGFQLVSQVNTTTVFQAADSQGIPLVFLSPSNPSIVETLAISSIAKARITTALQAGLSVIVPSRSVTIGGAPAVAWYEVNQQTGETTGVGEDGAHQDVATYAAVIGTVAAIVALPFAIIPAIGGLVATRDFSEFSTAFLDDIRDHRNAKGMIDPDAKKFDLAVLKDEVEFAEKQVKASAIAIYSGFATGYINQMDTMYNNFVARQTDPPLAPSLFGLPGNMFNQGVQSEPVGATVTPGSVTGVASTTTIRIGGALQTAWSSGATSGFEVNSLSASSAKVMGSGGASIGSGTVALATSSGSAVAVAVNGNGAYRVNGTGSLSFYGPAESSLGVSGEWTTYTAGVAGAVSITLTTGDLTLNGKPLPAGTYTITASSATLAGSGPSSSPNFSGSASINATAATLGIGPGGGNVAIGGKPLDLTSGGTLTGYSGSLTVAAGGGNNLDTASFNGNAANVLTVSASPATLATDQNTPVTFQANINTSLADQYKINAFAPPGWTVTIAANGLVTAVPAPGTQGGTFPIEILAWSATTPELIARTTVDVTIRPTQPGVVLNVSPDLVTTVPYNGAQIPSAFQATIQNLGPAADTFNLTFSNLPSGFTLIDSGASVPIPAGQTGIVGLYLQPNAGQPIPPVGSRVSFTVTATSASNALITQTRTETFIVPAIDGVATTVTSAALTSVSGAPASTTLTLTNVGNVAETVTPSATLPPGVTAFGLAPVTIQPGQSRTETITLTPDSTVALNSPVAITITATYGPVGAPLTTTTTINLVVRSAQVLAVQQAASAVSGIAGSQIGTTLSNLADALAQLQGGPNSGAALNRVQFLLGNLNALLQADPALTTFVAQLLPLQTAANAGNVGGLFAQTATFFTGLASVLTQEANQQFTASLSPNEADLVPGQGQVFNLVLTSQSMVSETLNLSTLALPANVAVSFGQTQVTLAAGQTLTVPVTLSDTILSTKFFTLSVTANAGVEQREATAFVAIRPATADVLSATATPVAANPGDSVAVSATIFNTANATRDILARVDLIDSTGTVVRSLPNIPVTLTPSAAPIHLSLGSIATTGLANGLYGTRVSLLTLDGVALPGRAAQSSFEIGAPVSLAVTQSTDSVPPGSSSVTTSLTVTNQITTGVVPPARFGDIQVFYSAANSFGLPDNLDGAVFVIENASGLAITNAVLSISPPGGIADSFNVGTIAAGGRAIIQPGVSDDGGTNHTFFKHTGTLLDESDLGPNSDSTQFDFKGSEGAYFIDSGPFTPAATKGPSVSDPGTILNFLGGPDDAPAHDFAPQVVANLYGTFQQPPGLTVEVGYADNLRANPFFPNPWNGSPNTAFVGNGPSYDSGALRIINDGTSPVTINDVTVTLFNGVKFDLWGSNTIPAGGNLILAQSGSYNFDSSDDGVLGYPNTYPDGETAHAARVDVTVNGQLVTLLDTGHVLTTGGSDLAAGGKNESQNWRPIGTTGISNPGGSGISVVVTDNLPASGYNVDPATISPTASTVSPTQVIWTPPPLTEAVPTVFQLTGTVTNMAPGEVRQISTGSSVVATTIAPDGTPIQTTVPFGPLVVAADHIISLAPPAQSIERAGQSTFLVTLSNPLSTSETYTLSTQGLDGFSTQLVGTVTVAAGQSVTTPLTITAPVSITEGMRGFVVIAQTSAGGQDSAEGALTVLPSVALATQSVAVALSPSQTVAGPGTPVTFQVIVSNTGDQTSTYNLSGSFPPGFTGSFLPASVTVPPGLGNSRTVFLRLTPPPNASAGAVAFRVTATSTTDPTVTGSAGGTVTVVQNGVNVTLSPSTGAPGDSFTMTVKNVGTVTDTFDLSLAGPAALASSLARTKVTLAPGASQAVTITTSAITFAVPGPLDLTAVARSEGNPAVLSAASSTLTIGDTVGLGASLAPSTQILPIPGTTSFLLIVTNTGNTEDAYTATITGTTGPVAASLLGLEGQITQTIPLFRLPGLSSAAILINADLMALGQGTVTVQVKSTTNPSSAASVTAQVKSQSIATTTLTAAANPITVGQAATFTAIVAAPAGTGTPTGTVIFTIDGVTQPPVALQNVGGNVEATLVQPNLAVGAHTVTASYSGDANFASNASNSLALIVNALAVGGDGPMLTGVHRYGYHALPTTYVLNFDQPLDPSRAAFTGNYRIVGPGGVVVGIDSAVYDPATNSVTLHPSQRLALHGFYRLTVVGTGPSGLTNLSGQSLDGASTGRPGSDFVTVLKAADLVLGTQVPGGPAGLAYLRRVLAQIVATQTKELNHQHSSRTNQTARKTTISTHAPTHLHAALKLTAHAAAPAHRSLGSKPVRSLAEAQTPRVVAHPMGSHRLFARFVYPTHATGKHSRR